MIQEYSLIFLETPSQGEDLIFFFFLAWFGLVFTLNRFAKSFSSPIRKVIYWLYAMSFESIAVFVFIFLKLTRGLFLPKTRLKKGIPVLLIHGYIHNSSSWIYLQRKLSSLGLGPVYTLTLKHTFGSIENYAKQVEKKGAWIEKKTGQKRLILIGHSMGGVVASWYALKLAPKEKVEQVVTLGSPLEGAYLAKIGWGKNAREIERGSSFIKELQKSLSHSKGISFYHLGSKTDQIVFPWSSTIANLSSKKKYLFKNLGHVSLLFSSRVAKKIVSWLEPA